MTCKTSDNLNLYYEVQGNTESSETIVLLNGLTQTTVAWYFVLPFFKDKYKLILVDFIFQGQSDKPAEWRNFDQHADDLKRLLEQEKINEVNILGLSYGSLVAQHFAVNHSTFINKLILISTFANKTPYYEAIELSWWRALEFGGYNLMQATKERKDYRPDLEKINLPVLIIQGEKDLLLPVHLAQEVNKHIKNSKLIIVKNAGHTLNLEHVPEVCGYVNEFLEA